MVASLLVACGGAAPEGPVGVVFPYEDPPQGGGEVASEVERPTICPFRGDDGSCYFTAEAACRAAHCGAEGCEILASHPAQTRCR